jgi:hypothetical protein
MSRFLILASVSVLIRAGVSVVVADDAGQIPPNVPNCVRNWFKFVKAPSGVLCCDIAECNRTIWGAGKDSADEVPIADDAAAVDWITVPPEAAIYNAGNPVGEAIVWYRDYGPRVDGLERYFIRCFLPGDGI